MSTPNIVPKFNEEGKVGRPSRRFSEIHGKLVYSDKLVLAVPEGQTITQSESSSVPSPNHLYFDNGRVVHGGEVIAWQSEVNDLKGLVDALLGDGSDGLSTLSSVVASIQSLDPGEDSFIEIVNKINAIEADYVTNSDIASLASVADLTSRMTNSENRLTALENQDTTLVTTVASQESRLDGLDSLTATTTGDLSSLTSALAALDSSVTSANTTFTADISSAVGRVATLEDNTIPAISSSLQTLTTDFQTSVTGNTAAFDTLTSSVNTLTSDLTQFDLNRVSDFSTLNTNLGALSTSLTTGLATKLTTTEFANKLSDNFPALTSSLLADYSTTSEVASDLASSLTDYVTASTLTATLTGYTTSAALQQGLDSLDSSITSVLSTKANSSDLTNFVSTSNLASTLNNQLTDTNLSSGGSLETLGAFVANTSQESAEFAANTAVNNLTLDAIGQSNSTVDWSSYSFSIGSLLISSPLTFMCADPNIEFNVGQPLEYLLEVPGGVTWKRGSEDHDAAILWDEANKLFHVRLAGPETYRLLTIEDLSNITTAIEGTNSALATTNEVIATIESGLSATNSSISELSTATSALVESTASEIRSELGTVKSELEQEDSSLQANITQLQGELDTKIALLTAEDASINSLISSTQQSILDLSASLTGEDSDIKQSVQSLQESLSSLSTSLGEEDTSIRQSIDALSTSLSGEDTSIKQSIEALSTSLNAEDATIKQSIEALSTSLEAEDLAIKQSIATLTALVASEDTAVRDEAAQATLAVTARVDSNEAKINEEATSLSNSISTLSATVTSLSGEVTSDVSRLEESITQGDTSLALAIQAVSDDVASLESGTSSALDAHKSTQNPHNIDKVQVGLSNVENVGISSWTGTSNISTVGTITSGTWSASPIETIANSIIVPAHISNTSDVFSFNNVAIQGQLTVSGNTIQVSTTEVNIGDNIIRLNADVVGAPTEDAGIEIERGDSDNVSILWKESGGGLWSIGEKTLEASGMLSTDKITLDSDSIEVLGEATFRKKLSVPHLDITSNMSLNTASSMIALNKDARYPEYPYVGTDADGANTEDIHVTTTYAVDVYNYADEDNKDESLQLNNDSGLKVVLGGADNSNAFNYAFLFWDVSESKWRLSESAPTTEETDSSSSITRTEIVDTTSGAYDILHSGHVGSSGQGAMGNTKLQEYSSELSTISSLSPTDNDFMVRASGEWTATNVAGVKQLVTYDTDDISEAEGSSNLYHTTSRVRGAISVSGDLSYNSGTGVISFTEVGFTGKDTDNLPEGDTNLYHTTARARQAITVSGDLSYNNETGVISYSAPAMYDSADFTSDLASKDTDNLEEGETNLYYTDVRARASVSALGDLSYNVNTGAFSYTTPDTDSVDEGETNLYHTTTRVRQSITGSGDISFNQGTGVISFTQRDDAAVTALANAAIAASDTDSLEEGETNLYHTTTRVRQSLSVGGDLSYNQNTGVVSFTQRSAQDIQTIIGITDTDDVPEGDNLYHTTARAREAVSVSGSLAYNSVTGVISYTTPTTNGITEGGSNLYYTNARAREAIDVSGDLTYNSGTGIISYTQRSDDAIKALAATKIGESDTDNLGEGDTNLYHTTARVREAVSASGSGLTYNSGTGVFTIDQRTDAEVLTLAEQQIGSSDTDDIDEGETNLYHTTNRVRGAISVGGDLSYSQNTGVISFTEVGFTGKDTDNLPEGDTNLYYTDDRAKAAITAGSGISISNGQVNVNADQSSVVTRINVQELFQKGSAWDRSTSTSNGDTTTSITLGYTTDGHAGPWKVLRKIAFNGDTPYNKVTYSISSGIDQYKSLPDTNFTLTSSTSGNDTVHSLTLA